MYIDVGGGVQIWTWKDEKKKKCLSVAQQTQKQTIEKELCDC